MSPSGIREYFMRWVELKKVLKEKLLLSMEKQLESSKIEKQP
jgi:hypothetical protein